MGVRIQLADRFDELCERKGAVAVTRRSRTARAVRAVRDLPRHIGVVHHRGASNEALKPDRALLQGKEADVLRAVRAASVRRRPQHLALPHVGTCVEAKRFEELTHLHRIEAVVAIIVEEVEEILVRTIAPLRGEGPVEIF